jgi:NIMA-interacting peptidyl-prolyl cis-trans isomerase 1
MAIHHSTPANPLSQLQSQGSSGSTEGKIRAAHLLVKHKDSRRPSSWKEPQITRSKEEAFDILKEHEKRIKSGDIGLGDLATSESDCSSARKKGDLYASCHVQ